MILNKKAFSLDGNQLKTLAVVFMIFDHIYSYLLLKIDANSLKDTFVKYQNATETGKDEFGKDKTHLEKFTGNDFYVQYMQC